MVKKMLRAIAIGVAVPGSLVATVFLLAQVAGARFTGEFSGGLFLLAGGLFAGYVGGLVAVLRRQSACGGALTISVVLLVLMWIAFARGYLGMLSPAVLLLLSQWLLPWLGADIGVSVALCVCR